MIGGAALLKSGSYDGKSHASRAVREKIPCVHLRKIAERAAGSGGYGYTLCFAMPCSSFRPDIQYLKTYRVSKDRSVFGKHAHAISMGNAAFTCVAMALPCQKSCNPSMADLGPP